MSGALCSEDNGDGGNVLADDKRDYRYRAAVEGD